MNFQQNQGLKYSSFQLNQWINFDLHMKVMILNLLFKYSNPWILIKKMLMKKTII